MSHIRDKWVTRDGRQTARFGHGKRWRATWTDLDGSEHGKCFDRKADAAHWLAVVGRAWLRAELLLAADGDGNDPSGFYVYLLWEVPHDPKPLYVGKSGNILGRLGGHLNDGAKRARVGWVTLIRCTSEQAMARREAELIRKYRPEWNKDIPLVNGGRERNGVAQPPMTPPAPDKDWQRLVTSVRDAGQRARRRAASTTPPT